MSTARGRPHSVCRLAVPHPRGVSSGATKWGNPAEGEGAPVVEALREAHVRELHTHPSEEKGKGKRGQGGGRRGCEVGLGRVGRGWRRFRSACLGAARHPRGGQGREGGGNTGMEVSEEEWREGEGRR